MSDRLHIDWVKCRGRGLCLELVPELLQGDPWGYPVTPTADGSVVVPPHLHAEVADAVRECPRLALQLRSNPR